MHLDVLEKKLAQIKHSYPIKNESVSKFCQSSLNHQAKTKSKRLTLENQTTSIHPIKNPLKTKSTDLKFKTSTR